ncbi:glycine/betaine ABC transporter [Pandoraea terrae]|uniref:Glycine/betaine ABC transporter n=1 Tax=Pandoraea terrae TaxID=1537710 RepID=A0A5E4W9A4_9BURK|nr:ABC transporter substrate-binding protein [Pandoraea terrae]VVE20194.1 glycine/betaine ABC transporter [Pandoraea terrae]
MKLKLLMSVLGICLTVAGGAAIAAPAAPADWCASGKVVKFGDLNWESGAFLTEVMRYVMEHGYGCTTDAVPGNTVSLEVALSNNDIQVLAEEWIGRSKAWNTAAGAGKVKGVGHVITGAAEGWYVPDYVVHGDPKRNIKPMAPGLSSVADLPKYRALFQDDEEPSKGRFLNCPIGWTCEGVNSQKLKAYGLTDSYVNFRSGTGAALDSTITSLVQRGKPILFYYWNPTPLMGRFRFLKLQEPAYNETCWRTLADKTHLNPCGSASPPADIEAGVSRAIYEGAPRLMAMLGKFNIPIDLLNQLLADQAERKIDTKTLARTFLQQHEAIWRTWVDPAAAQKIAASLHRP